MARADELIRLLYMSVNSIDGNPERSHINGLEHSLRVATLALRHNARDIEMAFVALVHDLARPLSDPYHGEVIAEIVRDMISEDAYHILRTHGQYQSAYAFGKPPWPDPETNYHSRAISLCAWEVGSFSLNWKIPTMTVDSAVGIIDYVCGDRD